MRQTSTLRRVTFSTFASAALLALPVAAEASCFSVFNRTNQLVFQSVLTPVDLSQPIGVIMQRRFPGHHLVWSDDMESCRELGGSVPAAERSQTAGRIFPAGAAANRSPLERSPLFQDIPTGQSALYEETPSASPADPNAVRQGPPPAARPARSTRGR
jgi:hypothetical protein